MPGERRNQLAAVMLASSQTLPCEKRWQLHFNTCLDASATHSIALGTGCMKIGSLFSLCFANEHAQHANSLIAFFRYELSWVRDFGTLSPKVVTSSAWR